MARLPSSANRSRAAQPRIPARPESGLAGVTERERASIALRAEQSALAEAQRISHVGSWIWDPNTGTASWSDEMKRIFGLDLETPAPALEDQARFYDAETYQRLVAGAHRQLLTGEPTVDEVRVLRPDGEERFVVWHGEAVKDAEGRIAILRGTVADITDRRRMEEALRASEGRIRSLVNDASVAIGISREGRTIWVNQAYLELFGFESEAELLGRPIIEQIAPHERDAMVERVRRRSGGEPIEVRYESTCLRRDGSTFPAHFAVSAIALPDGLATVGFITDLTQLKKAQAELARTEARYRTIVDGVDDVIFATTTDGVFTDLSPAFERVTGYPTADWIGRNVDELIDGESIRAISEQLQSLLDGQLWHQVQIRFPDVSGRERIVEIRAMAMREGGETTGVLGIARDVTERTALEEQLGRSQKLEAIGQLAGGIAHDFNNLLAVILSYVSLASTALRPEDAEVRMELEEIRKAGERAATLTRQLLAFARRQPSEPKVLDIGQVVLGMAGVIRSLVGDPIAVSLVAAPDSGLVLADRNQMEQVVMNLAVNARDAMPEGGELVVETRPFEVTEERRAAWSPAPCGPYVLLSVCDTGMGIAPEVLGHIFEPFFTTKEPGKGTGLGLATVFGIVSQSGGFVSVESTPGHGTTVNILLPRTDHASSLEAEPAPPQSTLVGTETILLVEDDDQVRTVARTILQRNGYTVLDAQNAGEALLIFESSGGSIDLLLTDVTMPRMSGPRLAQRLRERRPDLKVLLMSGFDRGDGNDEEERGPALPLLAKPYELDELLRKIREVLSGAL